MTSIERKAWDLVVKTPSHIKAAAKEQKLRMEFRAAIHLSEAWYSLRDASRQAESDLYALERKLMARELKKLTSKVAK